MIATLSKSILKLGYQWIRAYLFKHSVRASPQGHTASEEVEEDNKVVNPQGITVYIAEGDERGRQLVKNGGFLNPPTLHAWTVLLAEAPWTHIIDIGANYGEMLLSVPLPESARAVYAFEPSPIILPYLQQTIAESGLKINVIGEAVSDRMGTHTLFIDRNWSGTTRFAREEDELSVHDSVTVKMTTLSNFISSFGIPYDELAVLIKIDVEGHEIAVLEGLKPILESLGTFGCLVEVLHLSEEGLTYLIKNFDLSFFNIKTNVLKRFFPTSAVEFRSMINAPGVYPQDIVIRRKVNAMAVRSTPALSCS